MNDFLRTAVFIARHDLGQMLRQRETLLWTFVMPIIFFYFIGTVTGGFAAGGDPDRPDRMALLAVGEPGFLVDELVERLEAQNYAVDRVKNDEQLQLYTRRLTVPDPPAGYATFTDAVLAGEQMTLRFGRNGEGAGVQFDQVRLARAVYGLLADLVIISVNAGESIASEGDDAKGPSAPTREDLQRLREAPRALTLAVRTAGERLEPPSGYEQTIPGTTVMFTMMIMLTGGSIMLVIERQQGLLRRLAATPIPRGAVVLGKLAGRMALGVVQIGFGMAAGTVLFGMDWGPTLPMIALVLLAWALFNATLGLLLGNLARSEAQMAGMGIAGTLTLAALGGCWWPIEITPEWMQSLALALPTGWAMDAMHKMISFGYGASTAVPHLLALLTSSAILGWLSARTFRFQ